MVLVLLNLFVLASHKKTKRKYSLASFVLYIFLCHLPILWFHEANSLFLSGRTRAKRERVEEEEEEEFR
jgi:hypothetical protein